jgi:hypothetical protein
MFDDEFAAVHPVDLTFTGLSLGDGPPVTTKSTARNAMSRGKVRSIGGS